MDATNNIATDLFYKVRSRFSGLKLGSESGEITINPEDARFFDFDYTEGENAIGHVSISLAEANSMKVYFSTGITESMNEMQKDNWYKFLKELRQFAKRRLLAFDTRDIAKDNLDKRDYEFLSQYATPKQDTEDTIVKPVGENIMSESNMYGTKTQSFQKLLDTRLIVKHSKKLTDDQVTQPGARTRNISALFVENQEGERFKYPFIHLAGARAMQRHVANGGMPYDEVGSSIIKMSEEIAQLRSFSSYVVNNDLMNSETNSLVERSKGQLDHLREQIKKLAKQKHYEAYVEQFQGLSNLEVPEEVVEELTQKFTVKNFKEEISSVFPVLYRLMKENELGYNDIVEMTNNSDLVCKDCGDSMGKPTTDCPNDCHDPNGDHWINKSDMKEEDDTHDTDPFAQFEQWAMRLGEESAIQSMDDEEKSTAVRELQGLVDEYFPAGVDGTNAIQSLEGIIDDPRLEQQIKQAAKEDPDQCVRPMIKSWLEDNAPDVVGELDFGDMVEEEKDDDNELPFDKPEKRQGTITDKSRAKHSSKSRAKHAAQLGMRQFLNADTIKEVAEFIKSCYDPVTDTFPKGPTAVALMVGKKFGETAGHAAKEMCERMAPQQDADIVEAGRDDEMDAALHKAFGIEGDFVPFDKRPRDGEEIELQVPVRYTKAEQVIRDKFSEITGIDKDKVSVEYTKGSRSVKIDGQSPHPEVLSALNGTLDSLDTGGVSGMYDDINNITRLAGL